MNALPPAGAFDGADRCANQTASQTVALRDLLDTVRQELVALQHLSTDAQVVMSFALQQASLDAGQWSRAQSLDLITQRLEGLATFTAALAQGMPQDWAVDAASAVREVSLTDLANRLLCNPGAEDVVDPIELF